MCKHVHVYCQGYIQGVGKEFENPNRFVNPQNFTTSNVNEL